MTHAQAERLASLMDDNPDDASYFDPWEHGENKRSMMKIRLRSRPDLGWAAAEHIVTSGKKVSWLSQPEYQFVRLAVALISGCKTSVDSTALEVVGRAREIHAARETATLVKALLLCAEATVESVAQTIGSTPDVIRAYELLFFSVLDRKAELTYLRKIIQDAGTEEAGLLRIGLNGTSGDVLFAAGLGGRASAEEAADLVQRMRYNMLAEGTSWSVSGSRKTPPRLINQAMDLAFRYDDPGTGEPESGSCNHFADFAAAELESMRLMVLEEAEVKAAKAMSAKTNTASNSAA